MAASGGLQLLQGYSSSSESGSPEPLAPGTESLVPGVDAGCSPWAARQQASG